MARRHGSQVGIEAKIEYHPSLEILGAKYESWRRTALNWLQSGLTEDEVEKRLQSAFDIDWAWADSIATEASQCLDQLATAKELNIARIKEQIKKKIKRAKDTLKQLEKQLVHAIKNGFSVQQYKDKFANSLLGLNSKIFKIASLKRDLEKLETEKRLHICFGSRKLFIDFNKDHISIAYVKPDGNISHVQEIPFEWKGLTSGQRQARMRDIVAEVVTLAESLNCAIAIEALDFSKKKASMSEESKLYNEMLSNFSTGLFRTSLESRCRRFGIEVIKVNPAFTSVIGMIKFMQKYGLNSGTSAAMAIARRAMNLNEKIPQCLATPEDEARHIWSPWNRIARFLKHHRISRTRLFQWMKALKGILTPPTGAAEHQPSSQVDIETGELKNPHQSPKGEVRPDGNVQLCLDL